MISAETIEKIFAALNKNIELHKGTKISIVVCGGTALFVLDLVSRTTKDVDVLGLVDEKKGEISYLRKFPDWFLKSSDTVARDFNLPDDWINLGPAEQIKSGLPEGLFKRLTKKKYGKFLDVYFISRIDQIFFKLYASLDRGGYHVDDLWELSPSKKELLNASRWVLTQDMSAGFKSILISFLKKFGYNEIAEKL